MKRAPQYIFDEEEDAVYSTPNTDNALPDDVITPTFSEPICGRVLFAKANIEAAKIFGLDVQSGNVFNNLNTIFSVTKEDTNQKYLFDLKEDLVNREIIGKYLLLWNHVYSKLDSLEEPFIFGRLDDLFLKKMSYTELKVTLQHNPLYPNYEHSVEDRDCRALASIVGVTISKEQYLYGTLYERRKKEYPFISFADFEKERKAAGVEEGTDIYEWDIFGKDVLRGHPMEHVPPYTNCLATVTLEKERYNVMKISLFQDNLRLRPKITRNDQKKHYQVMTHALLTSRLLVELFLI